MEVNPHLYKEHHTLYLVKIEGLTKLSWLRQIGLEDELLCCMKIILVPPLLFKSFAIQQNPDKDLSASSWPLSLSLSNVTKYFIKIV